MGAPVSHRWTVRIPYKPEFFSGFLLATAKVVYVTEMIFIHIILHSAVHIYDFHILIVYRGYYVSKIQMRQRPDRWETNHLLNLKYPVKQ